MCAATPKFTTLLSSSCGPLVIPHSQDWSIDSRPAAPELVARPSETHPSCQQCHPLVSHRVHRFLQRLQVVSRPIPRRHRTARRAVAQESRSDFRLDLGTAQGIGEGVAQGVEDLPRIPHSAFIREPPPPFREGSAELAVRSCFDREQQALCLSLCVVEKPALHKLTMDRHKPPRGCRLESALRVRLEGEACHTLDLPDVLNT